MSKNAWLIIATLAALVLVGIFGAQFAGAPAAAKVAAAETPATAASALPRSITVVGQGSVSVKPDIAAVSVGVDVTAPTVKEATAEAASRMDKIMAALKAQGIAEKDIQTNNYSISYETRLPVEMPAVDKSAATPAQTGVYHVSNMVSIKIRDLKKVSAVVDGVVNAGANNMWGINFTLEDTSKPESEARAKAVADAKARAEELAKLAGVKVGPVVELSEIIGGGAAGVRYNLEAPKLAGGGAGPVSPGELEIATQVQVTFAIE